MRTVVELSTGRLVRTDSTLKAIESAIINKYTTVKVATQSGQQVLMTRHIVSIYENDEEPVDDTPPSPPSVAPSEYLPEVTFPTWPRPGRPRVPQPTPMMKGDEDV